MRRAALSSTRAMGVNGSQVAPVGAAGHDRGAGGARHAAPQRKRQVPRGAVPDAADPAARRVGAMGPLVCLPFSPGFVEPVDGYAATGLVRRHENAAVAPIAQRAHDLTGVPQSLRLFPGGAAVGARPAVNGGESDVDHHHVAVGQCTRGDAGGAGDSTLQRRPRGPLAGLAGIRDALIGNGRADDAPSRRNVHAPERAVRVYEAGIVGGGAGIGSQMRVVVLRIAQRKPHCRLAGRRSDRRGARESVQRVRATLPVGEGTARS